MAKARLESWVVSDAFWERVEPLIPPRPGRPTRRKFARKPGGGRKPKEVRVVFEAIVYVLRTGCQWKALPSERFGSASAIHKRFLEWEKAGFFVALWQAGLAEYDEMEGIALAMAEHRRGITEGTAGARVGGAQPHRPGKKMEASECCWSTPVASRCRSS